jgi:hypothetical protein
MKTMGQDLPITPIFSSKVHCGSDRRASNAFVHASGAFRTSGTGRGPVIILISTTANPSSAHFCRGSGSSVFELSPVPLYSAGTNIKRPGPLPRRESGVCNLTLEARLTAFADR